MKKNCEFRVNKHNIPKLKIYTQLAGIFYGTLGWNFLLCFLYGKYALELEYAGLILILSILMFMVTPVVVMDGKRENKKLFAIVTYGIMHGICTMGSVILLRFERLLVIYVIEILVVVFLIIRDHRMNRGNGFRNS